MADQKRKIVTVLGARPQFIKAAAVSHHLRKHFTEIMVHTGQHYDPNMSEVFFEELNIPKPDHYLNIGSENHGQQTGAMLMAIEQVLLNEEPDFLLVYGDTNSTLAGALAASKLLVPVIHVEAGLRSFNMKMPEEQNRILTDHLSSLLFAPTQTAVDNLRKENLTKGVHLVGDVMYDATRHFSGMAETGSRILDVVGVERGKYILCTIHRAENTNYIERIQSILGALGESQKTIVLPLHPRTQKYIAGYGLKMPSNIKVIEPLGYLDMVMLEKHAEKIVTDSGGVQKEAYFMNKPCITLRDETEWVETVQSGCNVLAGADKNKILEAILHFDPLKGAQHLFGDGHTAERITEMIKNHKR
jgi:UDP-GlcNAc3NAcA epimerase